MDDGTVRSKWPMDDDLHERITASLAAAGLGDAVRCIHTPSELGATLWQLSLTDERHGPDVEAALTRLAGMTGVLRKTGTSLRFDMDRTAPDAGRPESDPPP